MATDAPANPDAPTSTQTSAGVLLPTAGARRFIDMLSDAGCTEKALELFPNIKEPLRDVLNWSNPKFSKATKAVARSVGELFHGHDEHGRSTYPQAVELVGFLSMIAPLLEPDRIVRIAEHAAKTAAAFGPTLYPIGPSGQLKLMLSGYSEPRREELLISLWDAIHSGRWWDHTVSDGAAKLPVHHRRRKVDHEEQEAINRQISTLITNEGTCTLDLVTRAINARTLSFSNDAAELMARIPNPSESVLVEFQRSLAQTEDEDHKVLVSHIPFLKPNDRPESPAATMIALLLTARGGPAEFDFTTMPKDPGEWAELYPRASLIPFPYPSVFKEINGQRMPGLAGCDIMIIKNADQLKENGDYMGNCTFSYLQRCQTGDLVIGRSTYEAVDYNYELRKDANGTWIAGQLNSRFNGGQVPPAFATAIGRLLNGVNAIIAERGAH
jgi:hypothetical protein